jgi:DNA-directed RNA polymerase subunit RPC12/RpoP
MSGDKLKCKHCGRDFTAGLSCSHSPTKKHIALTNGVNCVYCGQKYVAGFSCSHSPKKSISLMSK